MSAAPALASQHREPTRGLLLASLLDVIDWTQAGPVNIRLGTDWVEIVNPFGDPPGRKAIWRYRVHDRSLPPAWCYELLQYGRTRESGLAAETSAASILSYWLAIPTLQREGGRS